MWDAGYFPAWQCIAEDGFMSVFDYGDCICQYARYPVDQSPSCQAPTLDKSVIIPAQRWNGALIATEPSAVVEPCRYNAMEPLRKSA